MLPLLLQIRLWLLWPLLLCPLLWLLLLLLHLPQGGSRGRQRSAEHWRQHAWQRVGVLRLPLVSKGWQLEVGQHRQHSLAAGQRRPRWRGRLLHSKHNAGEASLVLLLSHPLLGGRGGELH
jgi:hypothetical protein